MSEPRKRIRRSAQASKLAILQTAEARLIADGPDAVRVQPIARELGLTDAAVHYHFGSREALLETLLRYSGRRFLDELAAAIATHRAQGMGFDLARAAALLADFYDRKGAARLVMWLRFSGWAPEGAGMLTPLVDWLHEDRAARALAQGAPTPAREDSQYAIALLSASAMSQALFGDALLRSVDLDPAKAADFTAWLTGALGDQAASS
ncbi:TetR/AcrR family transcriptional regulator [Phenylobacterium sp.]|uniref:TetR/AcrR family transcriptional regulator n=1 Tax=Phenylobacterium sp. TaxID=1871053 RepID=UPI0030F4783A